jgi:uncharacterized protein (TIGR02284 family)
MITNKKATTEFLNTLLTRCYDSEAGYKKAAEDVDNPALTEMFNTFSDQRKKFGHEIKTEIINMGGKPEKGTSTTGDLHRVWIDVKSLFTSGGEDAILNESIRGEESMIKDYEKALEDATLPFTTQAVLRNQLTEVRSNLRRINMLEKVYG